MAHKVTPGATKTSHRPTQRQPDARSKSSRLSTCLWCGRAPHSARRDCPASNAICHSCGKRGHWQQVCRFSFFANAVSESRENFYLQPAYVVTQEVHHVNSAPKGIFFDLD